jgi:hypothetical protein
MIQVVSIVGSLIILAAYAANQFGRIGPANLLWYSLANFVGSGVLAVVAVVESQWGFLLLEGVWSLVGLGAVVKILFGGKPPGSASGRRRNATSGE